MERLYHYKLWQSGLGQYVAQMGRLTAEEIRDRGGLIIGEEGREVPQGPTPRPDRDRARLVS